jgi:beta-fructofuranosidase
MSLPRVLTLGSDGKLKCSVAEEVNALRGRELTLHMTADEGQNQRQIKAMRIEKCCGEILCKLQRGAEPFELMLCGSPENSAPWLMVKYDPQHPHQISIDARPLPVTLGEREHLELNFYIDRSVIEVFINDQVACTRRFYYTSSDPQDLRMKWTGRTANIASLSVWQLSSISSDRPTS